MNSLKFQPIFTYNVDIPDVMKRFIESQFIKTRNEAIEFLNPHYEDWNAMYDKEVSGADDMEYNAYIQRKENEILEHFNKVWMGPVKLYADEYADIAGRVNVFGKEVTVHMSLKPVD